MTPQLERTVAAAALWLCAALVVRGLTALVVTHPGYMDAYYAYHVAARVAGGQGLTESVAWNFLTPAALPRPSNAYWPPGTALFAVAPWLAARWLGAGAFGWRWAQAAPVAVSAALCSCTYLATRRLASGPGAARRASVVAWLLLFSGVYFPYWVTSDAFTPTLLVGGAALWLATELVLAERHTLILAALAGTAGGLLAAFRADGALILSAPLLAAWLRPSGRIRATAAVLLGAAVGIAPIVLHNLGTWRSVTPPGMAVPLWLMRYEDLFAYQDLPSAEHFLAQGAVRLASVRLSALAEHLGVLGQPLLYYLLPLTAVGLWRVRRQRRWWPVVAYLMVLLVVMTMVFPLPGARGGLFHSQVAALPFLLLWTALGLEDVVRSGARWRGWREAEAQRVFAGAVCALAVVSSLYFLASDMRRWDERLMAYRAAADWLDMRAPLAARVMAVDPPGFWYASGRAAVMVPSDGFGALTAAAEQFGVAYVLVERAAPAYLGPVYDGRQLAPDLQYLATVADIQIYRILVDGQALVANAGSGTSQVARNSPMARLRYGAGAPTGR